MKSKSPTFFFKSVCVCVHTIQPFTILLLFIVKGRGGRGLDLGFTKGGRLNNSRR